MDTKLEEAVISVGSFIFGIAGDVISFCVTCGLLYSAGWIVCRYLICENDEDIWSDFSGHIRSGFRGLAEAFSEAVPGIKAAVKNWVDDMIG